jgi:hypothetical protein
VGVRVKKLPVRNLVGPLVAAGLLLSAGAAAAHHSYAAFDRSKKLEMAGTVKAWDWTNPHVWLTITVPQKKGEAQSWAFEGMAPGTLRAKGWSRTMMKPGDKVTVVAAPRRDGTAGGALISVTLAGGQTFGGETPAS